MSFRWTQPIEPEIQNPENSFKNKSTAEKLRIATFSNHQKIQRHFYRAHACFVKYFLMTKKLQQIKKLAYVTTCGPSGLDTDRSADQIRNGLVSSLCPSGVD